MNIALLVTAAPGTENAWHALRFCEAACTGGHTVSRVFFYGDGVLHGNSLQAPPQDEPDLHQAWSTLADSHGIELVVCVAAALKRGVLDAEGARRAEKPAANAGPAFVISGLGQLVEAMIDADRFVSFA
jgi:tRNA 2-thiouridine synthesizing protein D